MNFKEFKRTHGNPENMHGNINKIQHSMYNRAVKYCVMYCMLPLAKSKTVNMHNQM